MSEETNNETAEEYSMRLYFQARLRSFFRSISSLKRYRYSLIGSQDSGGFESHGAFYRKHPSLINDLPFFVGLPLSVLLLYIHPFLSVILSVPVLILALIFFFHIIENSLVYAANEPEYSRLFCESPENYGFHTWEPVKLYPEGKKGPIVTSVLLFHDDPTIRSLCPTILILHGNAGNIGHRFSFCRVLADHIQCNILIVEYRGYGLSTGKPSEVGLYADAQAGLNFLLDRSDIARDKLFVFGRSIGGAVAIQLSSQVHSTTLRGVIVENTFTSLPEAAQSIFARSFGDFVRYMLPKWLFLNQYHTLELFKELCGRNSGYTRFLFLSGSADDLIPPRMMQKLADVYQSSLGNNSLPGQNSTPAGFLKDGRDGLVCFPGGQHNTTWLHPDWGNVISRFIQQACNSTTDLSS